MRNNVHKMPTPDEASTFLRLSVCVRFVVMTVCMRAVKEGGKLANLSREKVVTWSRVRKTQIPSLMELCTAAESPEQFDLADIQHGSQC